MLYRRVHSKDECEAVQWNGRTDDLADWVREVTAHNVTSNQLSIFGQRIIKGAFIARFKGGEVRTYSPTLFNQLFELAQEIKTYEP
jgi:hypothetical protein